MYQKLVLLITTVLTLISCSSTSTRKQDEFDKHYSRFTEQKAPGFQILVMTDSKIVKKASYGYANLEKLQKITNETKFRISSNTKAFTAAAALLLEQDGLLNPEDQLQKYFPKFPLNLQKIKIKHLIHHHSGLPEYNVLCERGPTNKVVTNKEVLKWLESNPKLINKPGTKFTYSNTGYVVLAVIIEKITGIPYPEFIQKKFFTPLKMNYSAFFSEILEDRAIGYNSWPWFDRNDKDSCNYTYGDDGIFTTTSDLIKWLEALMDGTYFKPQFQKKITHSGKYSYGWFTTKNSIYHSGSWTGYKSYIHYEIKQKKMDCHTFKLCRPANQRDYPVD